MKYLNALNKIPEIGSKKLEKLVSHFSSGESIWHAEKNSLYESEIGEKAVKSIILHRQNINPDQEWEVLEKENIRAISKNDPDYPKLLKEISSPPFILYCKGNLNLNSTPTISIVGSRKFTAYGAQVASHLSFELAKAGVIIVSGMAIGIDSISHQNALRAEGKTFAVLGNSLDDESIHPRSNFTLSQEIQENGCLISEYPVKTPAGPTTFPPRNRIIAGLSLGTLVIEAGEKSGTLITANYALEYSRDVFAVPGSIFSPQSFGTHSLIKQGAKLVSNIQDILEEFGIRENKKTENFLSIKDITEEEKKILKILSHEPIHIDNIVRISKLKTMTAASVLSMMEIKGWIKNIGGQNFVINNHLYIRE